jgi:hypothetical protein
MCEWMVGDDWLDESHHACVVRTKSVGCIGESVNLFAAKIVGCTRIVCTPSFGTRPHMLLAVYFSYLPPNPILKHCNSKCNWWCHHCRVNANMIQSVSSRSFGWSRWYRRRSRWMWTLRWCWRYSWSKRSLQHRSTASCAIIGTVKALALWSRLWVIADSSSRTVRLAYWLWTDLSKWRTQDVGATRQSYSFARRGALDASSVFKSNNHFALAAFNIKTQSTRSCTFNASARCTEDFILFLDP